jgi:hypothetical protein
LEVSDFSAEEVRASLKVTSANLSQEYIDTVQAEQQQVLASIESALVPAAIPVQKEWGSNETTQPATPLSKIKSKTRPTGQTEGMEEIESAVAGMTVDSGRDKDKIPKVPVKKALMIC